MAPEKVKYRLRPSVEADLGLSVEELRDSLGFLDDELADLRPEGLERGYLDAQAAAPALVAPHPGGEAVDRDDRYRLAAVIDSSPVRRSHHQVTVAISQDVR